MLEEYWTRSTLNIAAFCGKGGLVDRVLAAARGSLGGASSPPSDVAKATREEGVNATIESRTGVGSGRNRFSQVVIMALARLGARSAQSHLSAAFARSARPGAQGEMK